ncbi:hypothetical protein DSLASN_15180 [Desulfoluna limicola]|uniref:Uncharacterized protein n=1 Tax=Desulfoluna limicola TaxID=2810562 RepID=A0ABM7PFN7_9BACT|nr:hypothetical protein DSLASN_15180 [Desulfoluna limicola]
MNTINVTPNALLLTVSSPGVPGEAGIDRDKLALAGTPPEGEDHSGGIPTMKAPSLWNYPGMSLYDWFPWGECP